MLNEKKIDNYFNSIKLPENSKEYISSGITKAHKDEKNFKDKKLLKACCLALVILIGSSIVGYNTSPTLAGYIDNLPNIFKGFSFNEASSEEYSLLVNQCKGNDTVKVNISKYCVSSDQMYLFYNSIYESETIETYQYLMNNNIVLKQNNKEYPATVWSHSFLTQEENPLFLDSKHAVIEIGIPEGIDTTKPLKLICSIDKIKISSDPSSISVMENLEYKLPAFQDKKNSFKLVGESNPADPNIMLDELIVTPLNSILRVKEFLDGNNYDLKDSKIKDIQAVKLEDSKGNHWGKTEKGRKVELKTDASGKTYILHSFYLETPYYANPEKLFVKKLSFALKSKNSRSRILDFENIKTLK